MKRTMAIVLMLATMAVLNGCTTDVYPTTLVVEGQPFADTSHAPKEDPPMYNDDPEIPIGVDRRPKGWQNSVTLVTGDDTDQAILQADFPESMVYTVQFSVPIPPPDGPPGFGSFNCIAEVLWKVAGGVIRREVSVGDGTSISAPSQGVEVRVKDAPSTFGSAGLSYTVHAQVTRGVRAVQSAPPSRIPDFPNQSLTLLAPGASITVPIPRNAGIISVETTTGNFTGVTKTRAIMVEQIEGVQTLKVYNPEVETGYVPLKAGSSAIKATNYDVNPQDVSFIFGVDG